MKYPNVRRSDYSETLHGTVVNDPYRWLEDPEAAETKEFVSRQNECTEHVFDTKIPYRQEIEARMTELYNYEKFSCPMKRGTGEGSKYFYYKNDGLQNQAVLYMQETLTSSSQILLDPNKLSTDGTAALGCTKLSESAKYFAHGISRGGSDWQTIKVMNVETKQLLPEDVIQWVKFSSIAWMHDDSGFFYSRFPAPKGFAEQSQHDEDKKNESAEDAAVSSDDDDKRGTETDLNRHQQIWFHKIGTTQSHDVLVYAYPSQPTHYINAEISDDGNYLIIYLRDGCKNACMVHIADLTAWDPTATATTETADAVPSYIPVQKLVDTMDASFDYLLNEGNEFYFQTNRNAPRERIVKTDISTNKEKSTTEWMEVIPEPEGSAVLESAIPVGNNSILVKILQDVKNVLHLYTIDGVYKSTIPQPSVGTVMVQAKRFEDEFFFKFTSFLYPGSIFRHSLTAAESPTNNPPEIYRESQIKNFDASLYETKQIFYESKDGTKIPMFLIGKAGLVPSGTSPVYLYGYGGFNISIKPSFSVFRLVFVQHFGGLLAFPGLRGGSEYGEEWHQMGTFAKKQNVFDDFQCAAEYLIKEKYTVPSKIAVHGGSNGGLLVGACANQRPDLFGCAVAAVGVMDMLRFHKFTCGAGWRSDYGDPDIKEQFEYILKYSPVHNVPVSSDNGTNDDAIITTSSCYPNVLLTTGDHDDRVVPLHSYKYIAQLQHSLGHLGVSNTPLLIRIETKAGHGAGKPTSKVIQEYADVYAFIAWSLGEKFIK